MPKLLVCLVRDALLRTLQADASSSLCRIVLQGESSHPEFISSPTNDGGNIVCLRGNEVAEQRLIDLRPRRSIEM